MRWARGFATRRRGGFAARFALLAAFRIDAAPQRVHQIDDVAAGRLGEFWLHRLLAADFPFHQSVEGFLVTIAGQRFRIEFAAALLDEARRQLDHVLVERTARDA